ncbi:MAG TPA: cyclohexanecarboxylate-CoA ligase [Cycloclasticus sp.]|jgi:cyclohexanecarboxylate-CoA ligase|nr:cyclohexanecarboxylate-CoA ligase [Cycloclasticus sp.]HIL92827.1 cyclohexanecarboxylate-CoA ligase [Cycloclasticus sp.]
MSIAKPILSSQRIETMQSTGHWQGKTILDFFDANVAKQGDKTAVIAYGKENNTRVSKTYQELADLSDRFAAGLLKQGIKKGDVVSYQLPNWWEFVVVYLACMRVGAISNPLMPIFREQELSFMLSFAESKLVIGPDTFKKFNHAELLNKLQSDLPSLEAVWSIGDNGLDAYMVEQVTEQDRATFEAVKLTPNDVFLIMYTSGTTGAPKGVMHTSNTHEYSARKFIERSELTSEELILMGSPTAHMTGLMYGVSVPIMLGSTTVLLDQWDADLAWKIIRDEQIAFTMGATPFLADLSDSSAVDDCNHDKFRLFACGGAPVPPALGRRASARLNVNLVTVWGMTEMSAVTTTLLTDSEEKVFETDGCPYDGTEVRVIDQQDAAVENGTEGRLQTRGAGNFVGYLKRPEAHDTDEEGWFETGDLAKIVHEHYIRITGRSKDIIIRGGENIPVAVVENFLYRHDALQDVAIVAKADERLGERACCYITLRPQQSFDLETLKTYLSDEGLSKNYWPEYLEILDAMPRTASGKIQKFKLRDMANNG